MRLCRSLSKLQDWLILFILLVFPLGALAARILNKSASPVVERLTRRFLQRGVIAAVTTGSVVG